MITRVCGYPWRVLPLPATTIHCRLNPETVC
jgi:hypothetical protein